jgi:RNA polymerase sigma-70 factor, ECF subfamily
MDPTATDRFDALFREHYGEVRAYALRRAPTAEQAHDAVAETFLVAWRRIDDVPEDAHPWLRGVARKVIANQRRSDGRGAALKQRLADAALAGDGDPADIVAEAELMRDAFARLSDRDREVLLAAGWSLPPDAAGGADDVTPGAFAVRLHRARTRLKQQVRSLEAVPAATAALALTAALLLTPPGRAGLSWAADLIGIGEVGGSPSVVDRGPFRPTTGPLVVDNGRAPDGSRYEWVAHRGGLPAITAQEADPRTGKPIPGAVHRYPASTGLCLFLEWPGHRERRGSGGCSPRPEPYAPAPLQSAGQIQSFTWSTVQRKLQGFAQPDIVLSGTTSRAVHRLAISYSDSAGRHRLPVDFARVDGGLARRLGMPRGMPGAFGVFTAFVPGALAARDRLADKFPGVAMLVDGTLRTGDRGTDRCMRRHGGLPAGPFALTAYGENGRAIELRRTLAGEPPRACYRRWFDRELP